jgi:hypothetical protein
MASNEIFISKYALQKCGKKRFWPNLNLYPRIFPDGLRETRRISVSVASLQAVNSIFDIPKYDSPIRLLSR